MKSKDGHQNSLTAASLFSSMLQYAYEVKAMCAWMLQHFGCNKWLGMAPPMSFRMIQ